MCWVFAQKNEAFMVMGVPLLTADQVLSTIRTDPDHDPFLSRTRVSKDPPAQVEDTQILSQTEQTAAAAEASAAAANGGNPEQPQPEDVPPGTMPEVQGEAVDESTAENQAQETPAETEETPPAAPTV